LGAQRDRTARCEVGLAVEQALQVHLAAAYLSLDRRACENRERQASLKTINRHHTCGSACAAAGVRSVRRLRPRQILSANADAHLCTAHERAAGVETYDSAQRRHCGNTAGACVYIGNCPSDQVGDADELRGEHVARIAVDVERPAALDDAALFHDYDPV